MAKEIPVLFSPMMVKALLAGEKTMTRRTMQVQIKPCDHSVYVEAEWKDEPTRWSAIGLKHGLAYCELCGNGTEYSKDYAGIRCPYGKPGDLLWVRETYYRWGEWKVSGLTKKKKFIKYNFIGLDDGLGDEVEFEDSVYSKTLKETFKLDVRPNSYRLPAWYKRLARSMPKNYARIWLEVTDISVERLHDISEEDAIAEGVYRYRDFYQTLQYLDYKSKDVNGEFKGNPNGPARDAKHSFETLWSKINGDESWKSNCWVWVVKFKVVSTTGYHKINEPF